MSPSAGSRLRQIGAIQSTFSGNFRGLIPSDATVSHAPLRGLGEVDTLPPVRALFVCWDGPYQNYLESLFFPIFAQAGGPELGFDVLQFSFGQPQASVEVAAKGYGFGYVRQAVPRRFQSLSTAVLLLLGARRVAKEAARFKSTVLFPRSILAAGMCLLARRLFGVSLPMVFDADGLMADERVDFVGWRPSGFQYRVLRDIEAQAVRSAQGVIVRSAAAKSILVARAGAGCRSEKICVIPNGKDDTLFRPLAQEDRLGVRASLGIPASVPVLAYCGSLGPQYCASQMLYFFKALSERHPDTRLLFLTGQTAEATHLLTQEPALRPRVHLMNAAPHEVPRYLGAADLGLALRRRDFSQQAVSPIKVAEYLLCGLPVLFGVGIGDLEQQVGEAGRGVDPEQLSELQIAAHWFADWLDGERGGLSEQARRNGLTHFSLARCGAALREVLLGASPRLSCTGQ